MKPRKLTPLELRSTLSYGMTPDEVGRVCGLGESAFTLDRTHKGFSATLYGDNLLQLIQPQDVITLHFDEGRRLAYVHYELVYLADELIEEELELPRPSSKGDVIREAFLRK